MKPHILLTIFYCLIWTSFAIAYTDSKQSSIQTRKDAHATPLSAQELKNLSAFSHLYGYIKYFYPSDEASTINWDKLALLGIKKVRFADSDKELILILNELFLPIAPELKIYPSTMPYKSETKIKDQDQLKPIYWQHLGHGISDGDTYISKRAARPVAPPVYGTKKGSVMYSTDAIEISSRPFKVTAYLKQSKHNISNMWLSVSTENTTPKHFSSKLVKHNPLDSWQHVSIEGTMPNSAKTVSFGFWTKGASPLHVKDMDFKTLSTAGNWKPLIDENKGGSSPSLLSLKWHSSNPRLNIELKKNNEKPEDNFMVIEPNVRIVNIDSNLFVDAPSREEWFTKEIHEGITISMPLVVFGNGSTTFPIGKGFNELDRITESQIEMSHRWDNVYVRLADIVILWNTLRHFYPYYDETDINWNILFKNSIIKSITNITPLEHQLTIKNIVVAISDGHGQVHSSLSRPFRYLPISLKLVEEKIYVEHSYSDQIKAGDRLHLIDELMVTSQFQEERDKISGSEQHKDNQALSNLTRQKNRSLNHANLTLIRNNKEKNIKLKYQQYRAHKKNNLNAIHIINENIYYVDMTRITDNNISNHIDKLAKSKGVIFDIRGYPTSAAYKLLPYLIKENDKSNSWMKIPQILYPNNEKVEWQKSGWNLSAKTPHIGAKRIFLINSSAISYAESIIGFIDQYELGLTIGQSTSGANGNVNRVTLPSDITVSFTGMKVTKHNGEQLHNIGYKPSIPIIVNVSDLKKKKDKTLEKALEILTIDENMYGQH